MGTPAVDSPGVVGRALVRSPTAPVGVAPDHPGALVDRANGVDEASAAQGEPPYRDALRGLATPLPPPAARRPTRDEPDGPPPSRSARAWCPAGYPSVERRPTLAG